MDTDITLECLECHSKVTRPAHIKSTGHVCINWPSIICRTCNGTMVIDGTEKNEPSADNPDFLNWFSEEPDVQKVLEEQHVLHMAKPKCQLHRCGELYMELLEVIKKGGVVVFPDGRKFVVEQVNGIEVLNQ